MKLYVLGALLILTAQGQNSGTFIDDIAYGKKIVVDLQSIPNDTRIEFLIGTDLPHLTKDQLMQAIVMFQTKRLQSDATCILTEQGGILNYPCKVRTTQPHPLAKSGKKK